MENSLRVFVGKYRVGVESLIIRLIFFIVVTNITLSNFILKIILALGVD